MRSAMLFIAGLICGGAIGWLLRPAASRLPADARVHEVTRSLSPDVVPADEPAQELASRSPSPEREPVPATQPDAPAEAPAPGPSATEFAEPSWRDRLLSAASTLDRQRVLHDLLAHLVALAPDERALELTDLLKNSGWFGESAGPPISPELWALATRTLAETKTASARVGLVEAMGQQLANARGDDAYAQMLPFSKVTLASEIARLERRPLEATDETIAAVREQIAALSHDDTSVPANRDALLFGVFGIGGSRARPEDVRLLQEIAATAGDRVLRAASFIALASTPSDPATDAFLLRAAQSSESDWADRLFAWQALRRRGQEESLPLAVCREIIDAWTASGEPSIDQLMH